MKMGSAIILGLKQLVVLINLPGAPARVNMGFIQFNWRHSHLSKTVPLASNYRERKLRDLKLQSRFWMWKNTTGNQLYKYSDRVKTQLLARILSAYDKEWLPQKWLGTTVLHHLRAASVLHEHISMLKWNN